MIQQTALQKSLTLHNGETITYHLEHRTRRTVGLKITENGLVVHAPKRIFAFQLNQILLEKSSWILNKLQAREANQIDKINWVDGEHLLYLGQDITLKLVPNKSKSIHFERNELIFTAPEANIHGACRASVLIDRKSVV